MSNGRGKRVSIIEDLNAPEATADTHTAERLTDLLSNLRENIHDDTNQLNNEDEDFKIWYVEGQSKSRFMMRFGSKIDVLFYNGMQMVASTDILWVPAMLTFGRATWIKDIPSDPQFRWLVRLDLMAAVIYILGTFRRLITSTVNLEQAVEYVEFKRIMKFELSRRTFWMDLVSMFGHLWVLPGHRNLCVLRLVRSWRLLSNARSKCYKVATGRVDSVAMTVFKLALTLFLVGHVLGCSWFAAVLWPFRNLDELSQVNANYFAPNQTPDDFLHMYFSCLYDGLAMIISWTGPTAPHSDGFTTVELLALSIFTPISGIFLAYVVGGIIVSLERASYDDDKFTNRIDKIDSVMVSLGMPPDTRRRVMKYHCYLGLHNLEKEDVDVLFNGLSSNLTLELKLVMYESLIASAPFLQEVPVGALVALVKSFDEEVFSPGDTIVKKDEIGHELFFVMKGKCEVLGDFHGLQVYAVKNVGDFFGEVAIVMDTPRTAWIKAKVFSVLAKLTKHAFDDAVLEYPLVKERMVKQIMKSGMLSQISLDDPNKDDTKSTPLLSSVSGELPSARAMPAVDKMDADSLEAKMDRLNGQLRRMETMMINFMTRRDLQPQSAGR